MKDTDKIRDLITEKRLLENELKRLYHKIDKKQSQIDTMVKTYADKKFAEAKDSNATL
jgi:hypothetical protein